MIVGFADQLERPRKKLFLKAGILFWDLKDVGTLRIINLRVSDGRGAVEKHLKVPRSFISEVQAHSFSGLKLCRVASYTRVIFNWILRKTKIRSLMMFFFLKGIQNVKSLQSNEPQKTNKYWYREPKRWGRRYHKSSPERMHWR